MATNMTPITSKAAWGEYKKSTNMFPVSIVVGETREYVEIQDLHIFVAQ